MVYSGVERELLGRISLQGLLSSKKRAVCMTII